MDPRFAGRQYMQSEVVINENGRRVYGAFNTAEIYEKGQILAGPNT